VAGRYRTELLHDGRRYFLAYAILAIEPFVLVPLLLGFMTLELIGALAAVEALVVVLAGITQLGVKFAYLQHVADEGELRRGPGFWTATSLTAFAGLAAGTMVAPLLDVPWLSGILGLQPQIRPLTLGGVLLLANVQMMLVTDLRARRNPLPFMFSSALRLGLMLLLVAWLGPGAAAPLDTVLLAQALAMLASSVLLWAIAQVPGLPIFKGDLARRFLAYGWPIAVGNFFKYGADALLPWLCLALVSPLAAGAMALALKASAVFDTAFGQPFLMAWGGRAYILAGEVDVGKVFARLFGWIVGISLLAAVLSWMVGVAVLYLADAEATLLAQSLPLLPLAVIGRMLFTLQFPASVGYLVRRDMRWNLWVALTTASLFLCFGPWGFGFGGALGGWLVFLAAQALALVYIYCRSVQLLGAQAATGRESRIRPVKPG